MTTAIASICFDRPEFHEQSLESLAACRGAEGYDLLIFCDQGGRCYPTLPEIVRRFEPHFKSLELRTHPPRKDLRGIHILQDYDYIFGVLGYERLILVEEDVIVSADLLRFVERAEALACSGPADVFSVCTFEQDAFLCPGGVNRDAAIHFYPWFSPWGVSMSRRIWERYCWPMVERYIRDPFAAFAKLRPMFGPEHLEKLMGHPMPAKPYAPCQDILLNMIRAASGLVSVYPLMSRSQHIGWYGRNMRVKTAQGRDPRDPKNHALTPNYTAQFRKDYAWNDLEVVSL